MITKRIIPCLDVKNGRVVKGVNFEGLSDVSSPVELAKFYTENGADDVSFLAAVNVGEPFIPIAKSASGGEMSRIMLAIKTVIAKHDGLPTVIFDEVDTGVSGKTSRKIGFSLLSSAQTAQILSITHSAQIASLADRHLLVYKREVEGRPESSVRTLNGEERVEELARILGGIAVTEAQREAARDMLLAKDM